MYTECIQSELNRHKPKKKKKKKKKKLKKLKLNIFFIFTLKATEEDIFKMFVESHMNEQQRAENSKVISYVERRRTDKMKF